MGDIVGVEGGILNFVLGTLSTVFVHFNSSIYRIFPALVLLL